MTQHDGGKGDKQIPAKNLEQFNTNWDTIFKKPQDFFNRAKEVAKQIDDDEYITPED